MYTKNLAPLLYIQSDCDTASNRDVYVTELMKYIRVDSYGACLNNAEFDKRLNFVSTDLKRKSIVLVILILYIMQLL